MFQWTIKKLHFFDIEAKNCSDSVSFTSDSIVKIEQSLPRNYSCAKCLDFDGAAVPFAFPDRADWNAFYDKGLRFTPAEVDQVFILKAKILERMRNNTILANGIAFYFNLFKVLSDQGVTELDEDGLNYLLATFRKMITPSDYNRLLRVYKKIRRLTLKREKQSLKLMIETKDGQPLIFTGGDIPALDSSTRAMIDKYFKHIVIQHQAMISIEDQKISTNVIANKGLSAKDVNLLATSSISKVSGLEITGNFPVIGEVKASIKKVEIDLDSSTPAKVGIGFKKFVEIPFTFNLDY